MLTFALSMILYLLVFMYSRVITSPGMIILRSLILVLLAVESFFFAIMIRDWRQLQIGLVQQKMLRNAKMMADYYGLPSAAAGYNPAYSSSRFANVAGYPMDGHNVYNAPYADQYNPYEDHYSMIGGGPLNDGLVGQVTIMSGVYTANTAQRQLPSPSMVRGQNGRVIPQFYITADGEPSTPVGRPLPGQRRLDVNRQLPPIQGQSSAVHNARQQHLERQQMEMVNRANVYDQPRQFYNSQPQQHPPQAPRKQQQHPRTRY